MMVVGTVEKLMNVEPLPVLSSLSCSLMLGGGRSKDVQADEYLWSAQQAPGPVLSIAHILPHSEAGPIPISTSEAPRRSQPQERG